MKLNGEAIYGSRPWRIHAEGPTITRGLKRNNKGEEREQWDWRKEFTPQDIRFTQKDNNLYAIALAWPDNGKLQIQSLAEGCKETIHSVSLIGSNKQLKWEQSKKYLEVTVPEKPQGEYAFTFKIQTQ
jgi:alpha-L-fucosidase